MKKSIAILLSVMMSYAPHVVASEVATNQMIPTSAFVDEMNRAETQRHVQEVLSRAEIRGELAKVGLNQNEISQRLGTLTDAELKDLAKQIESAQYAGDGIVGVLVIVVLVLLIIYLAKRV